MLNLALAGASISADVGGTYMPVKKHNHKHPEVEQRVKALEAKMKKLENQLRDLQQQIQTHDHPHTH